MVYRNIDTSGLTLEALDTPKTTIPDRVRSVSCQIDKMIDAQWNDWQIQAEREIDDATSFLGLVLSQKQRKEAVQARVFEISDIDIATTVQAQVLYEQQKIEDFRHQQIINALTNVSTTVERGNIGAKVVDFATSHPILAGFLGTHIYRAIKDK